MVAFIEGHGLKRLPGYVPEDILSIVWEGADCFPAEYWSHPIERDGKPIGTVVTFVDITERKRIEEAVRESEMRYRLLFERNLAGVFRTTMEGRVLECNQAAAQMFGYDSPEETLRHIDHRHLREDFGSGCLPGQLKREAFATNHEVNFRRKNGDRLWAMLNATVVSDHAGAHKVY